MADEVGVGCDRSTGGDPRRASSMPLVQESGSDTIGEVGELPTTDASGESLRIGEIGSDGGSPGAPGSPSGNHPGNSAEKLNVEGLPPGPRVAPGQTKCSKPGGAGSNGKSSFETAVETSMGYSSGNNAQTGS